MFKIYSTCVFNFPDSVIFDHIVSTFSLSHSGKMWLHGLSIFWMCKKYANSVHCNHMTQYILNVATKEWLKCLLVAFFGKFKKCWVFADGAHCGHMIQYFLNILTICWAGKFQIHYSVYSERTQYVLIQASAGILDMEPPYAKHILAQYRGVCPQWDPSSPGSPSVPRRWKHSLDVDQGCRPSARKV